MPIILLSGYSKTSDKNELEEVKISYLDSFEENIKYLKEKLDATIIFVTLDNYKTIIDNIKHEQIWNCCDGIETDGYIGITLIRYLENNKIKFIGENSTSYYNTSLKTRTKELLIKQNIPTPNYEHFNINTIDEFIKNNGVSIVKYDCFYASIGLSYDSVIKTKEDALKLNLKLKENLIVEKYIVGDEFTILIYNEESYYRPIKKIFHSKDIYKQFITFEDSQATDYTNRYSIINDIELEKNIINLGIRAYKAVGCTSYARIDIRDNYVLEVNTYPAIGLGSSVDKILELNGETLSTFYANLI